ncbi:tetratricopeptide repeat protein [Pedobacter cryoconitis]|uniref:Tetratricopeptide repeat protein n=1 Tax=Pedobacter cryoconitis TaxID=188932 RepID=A0A7X0J513_9SPHI|nr:hypothetical protein [Pedobacter cryoconitis]MBB6501261.1 hypothetical protein [Pedobacter cryoconitis]
MRTLILSLALMFTCLFTKAQKESVRLTTDKLNQENLASSFNESRVRLLNSYPLYTAANGITGVFVLYEKIDTLSFQDPYFQNNNKGDLIAEGLAFYQKDKDQYRLLFANPNAFMCADCNNMHDHEITVNKDTVALSMSWGPSGLGQLELFKFVFRKNTRKWQCISYYQNGANDAGEEHRTYKVYASSINLYLDKFDGEETPYDKTLKAEHEIKLYYTPGKYKDLLDTLKKLPVMDLPLLNLAFGKEDATGFCYDYTADKNSQTRAYQYSPDEHIDYKISKSNVVFVNDIGYFLEQANALDAAEVFLKKVTEKFPDRMVTYLNLGDVYRKKNNSALAIQNYQTYLTMMHKRGLEKKTPQYVTDFLKTHR